MRVAIIGLGSIGLRHVRNVLALGGHKLALYDINAGKLAQAAVTLNASGKLEDVARLTIHIDALWKWKPESVLICTPPDSHVKLAHDAIIRGIPTFIEKPITNRLDDNPSAEGWLAELAERSGVITMVGCNLRYHAGPATIKRWLEDKDIGDVLYGRFYTDSYLPDWVPGRDYKTSYVAKTGVILDAGSHEVDLALWLLGPAKLKAAIWRPADSIGLDCDGLAELILAHESGAISTVHLSFVQPLHDRGCYIAGTKGVLEWNWDYGAYSWKNWKGYWEDGDDFDSETESDLMYKSELAAFLDCVEHQKPSPNPISQAMDVLTILREAKEIGKP
ncbi:MAG: Gfo/Idh/MocA family oxidoreductase [Dehalococcoidia bacterium]|nr:Gfo/Idh/MocA family oxidoreductase [Dehalococcoidia bacterium]